MSPAPTDDNIADTLKLRFVGENEDGTELHELKAAHVAEVLEGIAGLASDFTKAGAFGDDPLADVYVRPAREGSFIIEVVRTVAENWEAAATSASLGVPSLGTVLFVATKSARAKVSDFEYLENGNVKIKWQDDTADEVSRVVWDELQKRKTRRKKQLREIMAPLSDPRVSTAEVSGDGDEGTPEPTTFKLERADYYAVQPEDEIEEDSRIFETEAQMSAIDFDSADRWRVKTKEGRRSATVEDKEFLAKVDQGLAIHKTDIFTLKVREDLTIKNDRPLRKWTVLEVKGHRRSVSERDA